MVERYKLLNWWKHCHPSKKSAEDGSSSTQKHERPDSLGFWHALSIYGRIGWALQCNFLHLDKKSCAHTRDAYHDNFYQNRNQRHGVTQAHDTQLPTDKADNFVRRKELVTASNAGANLENGSLLHVNLKGNPGRSISGALDVVSFDLQQHKFVLKNQVLPLTMQEDLGTVNACKRMPILLNVVEEVSMPGIVEEIDLTIVQQKGPPPLKNPGFSRFSSTPVSPRFLAEANFRMSGTPRSLLCGQGARRKALTQESIFRKESLSTMGSPWNWQAGGNMNQSNQVSFRGLHKQGQWVTTDSDFVVLEL